MIWGQALETQLTLPSQRLPALVAPSPKEGRSRRTGRQNRLALGVLALSLAACQTPATRTQTVEVRVPVAVQPIKPEQVPTVPAPLGPRPESASAAADMLLADHCKWVAYGLLTDPLLRVSAGEPPKELPRYPECEK
jgi:hypothetical protein